MLIIQESCPSTFRPYHLQGCRQHQVCHCAHRNLHSKRINPAKIVGKHGNPELEQFINCSTSGDFIKDASVKVDKLYAGTLTDYMDNPVDENVKVKNIILSVGTNDIRRKEHGVNNLYTPFKALLDKCRLLFPEAKLFVQSAIPMGFEFKWTPRNVLEYNRLQRRCSREVPNCYYLDVFNEFLDRNSQYPLRDLFRDCLHPSAKGTSILARAFIKIARGRDFDLRM